MSSSRPQVHRRARPVIEHPTYKAPHYQSRTGGRLIFFLFLLSLCGTIAAAGALYWGLHRPQGSSGRAVAFHVGPGDSVTTVSNRLARAHLINSTLLFRIDARLHNLGGNLKVGDYVLRRNMSIDKMIAALQIYHTNYIDVVIPEGYRMEQIADRLQSYGIDRAGFLREARRPDLNYLNDGILSDKPKDASLEGYLFPNTYRVPKGFHGREFARLMVHQLGQQFTPLMRRQARQHGLTVFQTLTLASIVEREARVEKERPLIAGVYFNRLKSKMELGADPTVQYIAGRPHHWWPQLQTEARLVQPGNPYNSYTHVGLPPGPIANPGALSIEAASNPTPTNYLYFVAKGNGEHAFAATLTQQTENIARYQHAHTP